MNLKSVLFCCVLLGTLSCKDTTQNELENNEPLDTYFSINQYMRDQYRFMVGQPYSFKKVVVLNDKSDTTEVTMNQVDWLSIIKTFSETDISNPKFLGKYDFSNFDNESSFSSYITYTAKDIDLKVQKLNIEYDVQTNRILSIYIETAKESRFYSQQQKMTYVVGSQIMIQNYEKSLFSDARELNVIYYFN